MASRPRKKCAFFNKGQGLQDLESFSIEDCHQTTPAQQDGSTCDQTSNKDITKWHKLVKDIEVIDSESTDSNSCSTVDIINAACPSTKPSGCINSEPTNFNGIILGSVAALEDPEHVLVSNITTLNNKGPSVRTSPKNDTVFLNSCTPEKKIYTQLLTVQTDQIDLSEPYACKVSPTRQKVRNVSGIGYRTISLSGPEKFVTPRYDTAKDDYRDESNGHHLPPRPYTRRPIHSYRPYPTPSPSVQYRPPHINTAKGGWPSHSKGDTSSALSSLSSYSAVDDHLPSNKHQRSCCEPNSNRSEHIAVVNNSIADIDFSRTTKQYQQPLGNCNHINSDISVSKSNDLFHSSLQCGDGLHSSVYAGNISYQYQQSYLPPAAANTPKAHYHSRLYASYNNDEHHNGGGLGDTVGVDLITNSTTSCDRSAPRRPPVDGIGRSAFIPVMPQRGYSFHQPVIAALNPYHSGEPSSPVLHYNTNSSAVNGSSCSDDSNPAFPTVNTSERKRVQSCKLCRNHGVETPIKGHKYLCPYKKCQCKNCRITLNSRHFVKEQLKITRKQNVSSSQHLSDSEEQLNKPKQPSVNGIPFTMKEDMLKDMEKLNNLKLFKEIDKICRPQSSVMDLQSTRHES